MNNIKLSIIVLTYNHEKYIRKCLDSILEQNVDFIYEILIGNDNSPDSTEKILNEYKMKYPDIFKIFNRKANLGATKNYLDLCKKTSGEYVILLEGDDYWTDRNKLLILTEFLDNNKEYIGVFHKVNEVNEEGKILSTYPRANMEKYIEEINSIENFLKLTNKDKNGQVIHIQSIMYRNIYKHCLDDKTQKYLTSGRMIADLHTKLLILSMGKIKYINKNMGNYRRIRKENGTSFSSQSKEFLFNETITIWKAINEYYEFKYNDIITKIVNRIYVDMILYYLITKQYKNINIIIKSLNIFQQIKIISRSLILYVKQYIKKVIKIIIRWDK